MKICEYGCGLEGKFQLKNGKWCCSKKFNSCPSIRKRNSESHKGKIQSKETKKKKSKSMMGKTKGKILGPHSEEYKKKMSKLMQGKNTGPQSEEHRRKNSESKKGIKTGPQSEETKKKKSKSMMGKNKGKIPWNKGVKTGPQSEETKQKKSIAKKGIKTGPHSEERKRKNSESHMGKNKLTIKQINERYPLFSKVEKMRYNPDKPNEKEIQVHCKNHECENSKGRGGWFTPKNYHVFKNRIWALERSDGNDGTYFYCCQECKDTCPLYGLHSDPLKENNLPYTPAEWGEVNRRARERDNGLCRDCGKPGTEVHHIKPVKLEPFLALDIDNLVTLCEDCHKKYHEKGLINSTGNLAKVTCNPKSQKFLNFHSSNINL